MNEPRLVMATRQGRLEHTPEAEPVLVAWTSTEVVLVLDDGEELRFDRTEFEATKSAGHVGSSPGRRPENPATKGPPFD